MNFPYIFIYYYFLRMIQSICISLLNFIDCGAEIAYFSCCHFNSMRTKSWEVSMKDKKALTTYSSILEWDIA